MMKRKARLALLGCAILIATSNVAWPAEDWLGRLNYHRASAGLQAVTENASWSYGDWLHSRYCVKNNFIGHDEDPQNPWYTPEGDTAAGNSNVMVSSSMTATDESAIDLWMQGPFHALGILDPALSVVGFGSYREADGGWQMSASLNVLQGLGSIPPSVTFPVAWPSNRRSTVLTAYTGSEYPNPLSSCPGYTAPTGIPVILQLGPGNLVPSVTAHSFSEGGTPLEHCVFDETNYTNAADLPAQSLARSVLGSRDAVVLLPRAPLRVGSTYTASVTANGKTHTWSFSVTDRPVTGSNPKDLNGDGTSDILWRNSVTGQVMAWLMNGTSFGSQTAVGQVTDTNWRIAGTADLNRDGSGDILWRNYATGETLLWLMNGTSFGSSVAINRVADTNFEIAATGDFNGDGQPDILWRSYLTGQDVLWLMNGTSFGSALTINRVADTNWRIAAAADFNGDGRTDILWRHSVTGQNVIWLMNGTAFGSSVATSPLSDTSWEIAGPR